MRRQLRNQQLTIPVVEVFLSIEEHILINVAKRLRRHKKLLDDDIQSWQLRKLEQLGSLTEENVKTIAWHSNKAVDEVSKMLEEAGYKAVREHEGDLAEAVRRGILVRPPVAEESKVLRQVLNAYVDQAKDTFNLVNTTLLTQSEQVYRDIVNQTVGKVMAGVQTGEEALREVASDWANKGIPALIDRAGREWSTEAYMNMVTRSISNEVANNMQDARMDEYDIDLIEVSSHEGARPLCAPYQGRIYSRSGQHPRYPALDSTSYGEPAGLFGINCGHVKYPYIPGVTKKTYQPYDRKRNDRIYEESQRQRELERNIRKAKREREMLKNMGDQEGVKKAEEKIKDRQAQMREFIKETGRARRYEREKAYN